MRLAWNLMIMPSMKRLDDFAVLLRKLRDGLELQPHVIARLQAAGTRGLSVAATACVEGPGFGYRRCTGEQLTIQVFEDFLRKVWKDKIEFVTLNLPNPAEVPIGPSAVIADNLAFTRSGCNCAGVQPSAPGN